MLKQNNELTVDVGAGDAVAFPAGEAAAEVASVDVDAAGVGVAVVVSVVAFVDVKVAVEVGPAEGAGALVGELTHVFAGSVGALGEDAVVDVGAA